MSFFRTLIILAICLAAGVSDAATRPEMVRVALRLSRAGHVVTSRWIEGESSEVNDGDKAMHALADVSAADCLVLFTERPTKYVPYAARGERHVELGYALGLRKRVEERSRLVRGEIGWALPQRASGRYDDLFALLLAERRSE